MAEAGRKEGHTPDWAEVGPDLLAALKAFRDYDECDDRDHTGMMIAYDLAITAARAAIARAEGA